LSLSASVTGSVVTILVIVAYQHGSAAISDVFFDELSDLLERTSTFASSLIIAGDLNIHLDVTSDSVTVKFLDILDQHSVVQHVIGATHHAGHCHSVLITTHRAGHCHSVLITSRELCVWSVQVSSPMLSNHSCIVGRLNLLVPQDHSTVRRECRCWHQFDYDSFYADLCQSEMVLPTGLWSAMVVVLFSPVRRNGLLQRLQYEFLIILGCFLRLSSKCQSV